ncbi:MAG: phosphate signaling complex protein PhoU [Clostridia bacterium]|nr:phosphate signaling complex protein PhoU [Clostridia bacterium]MBN2882419.1 phosphate signaling complex protein PhoU [Clostridia bacterium]
MVYRYSLEEELSGIHEDMVEMGSLVEDSIEKSILALQNQDIALARRIFKEDDRIDEIEQRIEKKCLMLIARQQPIAKDLRAVSAALKIITDLERIGDHSADIAEITIRMAGEKYLKPLIDVPKMAELAGIMVRKSMEAYIMQDIELAKEVCGSDDEVDELFFNIVLELIEIIKRDPISVEQAVNFMFIAKYLERMADHATNISEWVVYTVTGEHEHLAGQMHRYDRKNNPFITD